jgi:citrate lyase subunit beta / citryl-CoA lyase
VHPRSIASRRSWLFVPADHAARVEKAVASQAHAVIIDLEDAVSEAAKDSAREALRAQLRTLTHPNLYVRINALDTAHALADVEAVVTRGVRGLVLPKSERVRDLEVLHWLVGQMERRNALEQGAVEIIPLIESAAGFEHLLAICRASARVRRVAFGAADFTFDLGLKWSHDEQELIPYRALLVLASRQAQIEAPIDTPWIDIGDRSGMSASTLRARDQGFQGKLCIHPDQIDAIHQAYAPSQAELDEARAIVTAFEAGGASATKINGKMVDTPIVDGARRMLAEADTRAVTPGTCE